MIENLRFSMTWVKICGMTNLEDALTAVDAGADAVGFVFYEKSARCVSVETVHEIVQKLPERVEKVGVFVNESPKRVSEVTKGAGLTAVQLHGDEYMTPELYSSVGKLFFSLPVANVLKDMTEPIGQFIFPKFPKSAGVLLDSGIPEQRGGTGKTFAWAEARWLVSALMRLHPVVIAGGLTTSNVSHAAEFLKPWGVDVVSGVEASPGKKDPEKVRAFVKAVRDYDRKVS
jgi:phosphoribosylanthranilate isomerase